jgi:hypothetical protein
MTDSTDVSLTIFPSHERRTTADVYSYDTSARLRRDQRCFEGAHTGSVTGAHQVCCHLLGYSLVEVALALVDDHYPVVNGDRLVKNLVYPLENRIERQ